MSIITLLSLFGYLLVLGATQTVYGAGLLAYRWYALFAFSGAALADWIVHHCNQRRSERDSSEMLSFLYLLMTAGTVVLSENWVFSGMRWASHALMLASIFLLFRQLAGVAQVRIVTVGLKLLVAGLLVFSWFVPAPVTAFDADRLYRGAMGNANTMGHIALIAAILYVHGFLTSRTQQARYLQGAFGLCAIATVWYSGARSSMVGLAVAACMILYFYKEKTRGLILAGILFGSLAFLVFPTLPAQAIQFIAKREDTKTVMSTQSLNTRMPVWSASWEGFKERPLFGWGFGADSSIPADWSVRLTALGTVERDAVNDFLFMMEGGGIIGLCAYVLLICIALKQGPSKGQRVRLRNFKYRDVGSVDAEALELEHSHAVFFTIVVSLLTLNQFDGTALSAGNLISVILWIAAASAGALRSKAHGPQFAVRSSQLERSVSASASFAGHPDS